MPNYSTNLKTWGSTGQEYPDNYSYVEGEQPVDAWDNFIMTNVINDIEHLIDVTNNDLLANDGSVNLQADLSDDRGNTIWDYSLEKVPAASQEASSITVSAGDGLKGGGSFSNQGGSTTLNIEPADFAGSGLQADGSDNLALTENSLSVTAGDGLKGGGSVNLGGSTTLNVEPSDFAGSGLQDDGNDNLQVNESQIATEEWELIEEHHDSNTGSVLDKTFDVSGESYDRYEVRWEFTTSGNSGLYCEFNNITEYDYWLRGGNGLEKADGYTYLSLVGGTSTGSNGNVGFGELRASAISDIITFSNTVASGAYTDQAVSGVAIGSVSSLNSIRLYSDTDNATGDLYLYGRNNG